MKRANVSRAAAVALMVMATILCSTSAAPALQLQSSSGEWTSLTGGVDPLGIGTNEVTWGRVVLPLRSSLTYLGEILTPITLGTAFSIGELRFHNGDTLPPAATAASLAVSLLFRDGLSTEPEGPLTFDMDLNETSDLLTTLDDALVFPAVLPTGTFVLNGITYLLEIVGFGATAEDLISQLTVPEGETGSTQLWARVTQVAVPEPGTLLLLGGGLLGVTAAAWRRRRSG